MDVEINCCSHCPLCEHARWILLFQVNVGIKTMKSRHEMTHEELCDLDWHDRFEIEEAELAEQQIRDGQREIAEDNEWREK